MARFVGLPTAPVDVEDIGEAALGVNVVDRMHGGHRPTDIAGAAEHRASAVTEQPPGAAVLPVQDARVDFAADAIRIPRACPVRIMLAATHKA